MRLWRITAEFVPMPISNELRGVPGKLDEELLELGEVFRKKGSSRN